MTMLPSKLERRFALLGVVLTWAVGGLVGLVGYRPMVRAVRREAEARVEDAVRVGQRVLETEFARLDPDGPTAPEAVRWTVAADPVAHASLAALLERARSSGEARGFALLPEGLALVAVRRAEGGELRAAALPLRGAHRLPDQIRDVVFGREARGSPTITLFEGDVRVATNVRLAGGQRAVGTRAAPDVARRVLGEGGSWNDRARVVDRWTISSYQPLRSASGAVLGMIYAGLDEAPYVAERERSLALAGLAVLFLTLAVSAGAWSLGGRLARPLTRLAAAASALARGERQGIGTGPGDPEEVRTLAEAFDRMSAEIEAQTAAREAARQRAEKALQDYLEVLGFVAHELKSPVSGALTQLDLIDGGFVGQAPEGFRRPLAAIRRYLDYGREIAQSFNQLSRAEGEGFRPRFAPIADLAREVVALAVGDCASEAGQRRMTIRVEGAGPFPVSGDPDLLRVVVDNLVGNAVKYGEEGTEVVVTLRSLGDRLRVEVTNRGVGIPPDRLGELFGKFHRLQDPQLRSRKGTGVGLYLVKRIVELHGGAVGAEGEYGSWVRFWFEVPQSAA